MGRQNTEDLKDVWQTPPELLKMITVEEKISLDPCAGDDTDIADTNYRKEDDGLSQDWFGRVFVNPPFSQKIEFLKKAVEERDNTDVIFVVTPDSTDTKSWWHEYIAPEADYVWFSEGRIEYLDPETGRRQDQMPTFGTAISVFGDPSNVVLKELASSGQLMKTVKPKDLYRGSS